MRGEGEIHRKGRTSSWLRGGGGTNRRWKGYRLVAWEGREE
jgi:hypothetical protein